MNAHQGGYYFLSTPTYFTRLFNGTYMTDCPFPKVLEASIARNAIREYAAHSYLYYKLDNPVISDGEYDELCKWLEREFEWVKKHDINDYLHLDLLSCGSGYDIVGQISGLTLRYAMSLIGEEV